MKTNSSGAGKIVGIAALIAGAAGAYYLYGSKKGPEHRKQLRGWMLHMKAEVMEEIEKVEDLTEEKYSQIVEAVAAKYEKMPHIDSAEVALLLKKMKGHWKDIKKDVAAGAKKSVTTSSKKK